jgi:hypothetical protein
VDEFLNGVDIYADVLLSHAIDEGVDFVVMGGYGHSFARIRAWWRYPQHVAHNGRAGTYVALTHRHLS